MANFKREMKLYSAHMCVLCQRGQLGA